jgi:hypothetical protein
MWPRLLEAAVHEAIADFDPEDPSPRPTEEWQARILDPEPVETTKRDASGAAEAITRTRAKVYEYETRDRKDGYTIHQSWDSREE